MIVSRKDFVTAWPLKDSTLKLLVFVGNTKNAITVTSEPAACKQINLLKSTITRVKSKNVTQIGSD